MKETDVENLAIAQSEVSLQASSSNPTAQTSQRITIPYVKESWHEEEFFKTQQITQVYITSSTIPAELTYLDANKTVYKVFPLSGIPIVVFRDQNETLKAILAKEIETLSTFSDEAVFGGGAKKETGRQVLESLRLRNMFVLNRHFNFKRPFLHQNYEDGLLFLNQTEMQFQLERIQNNSQLLIRKQPYTKLDTQILFHDGMFLMIDALGVPVGSVFMFNDLLGNVSECKNLIRKALAGVVSLVEENITSIKKAIRVVNLLKLKNSCDCACLNFQKYVLPKKDNGLFRFCPTERVYPDKTINRLYKIGEETQEKAYWEQLMDESLVEFLFKEVTAEPHGEVTFLLFKLVFCSNEFLENSSKLIYNLFPCVVSCGHFKKKNPEVIKEKNKICFIQKLTLPIVYGIEQQIYAKISAFFANESQKTKLWCSTTRSFFLKNITYTCVDMINHRFDGLFCIKELRSAFKKGNFRATTFYEAYIIHNRKIEDSVSFLMQNFFYNPFERVISITERCLAFQQEIMLHDLECLKTGKPFGTRFYFCEGCVFYANPFEVILMIVPYKGSFGEKENALLTESISLADAFYTNSGFRNKLEQALQLPLGEGCVIRNSISVYKNKRPNTPSLSEEQYEDSSISYFKYITPLSKQEAKQDRCFAKTKVNPLIRLGGEKGVLVFKLVICSKNILEYYGQNNTLNLSIGVSSYDRKQMDALVESARYSCCNCVVRADCPLGIPSPLVIVGVANKSHPKTETTPKPIQPKKALKRERVIKIVLQTKKAKTDFQPHLEIKSPNPEIKNIEDNPLNLLCLAIEQKEKTAEEN